MKLHTGLQPDTTSENCSQGSSQDEEAEFVPDADDDGRESPAEEGASLVAEAAAAEEPSGGADGSSQPTQLAQSSDQRT